MLQTISAESNSISKIVGELAIMKWTIVPGIKVTGTFALYTEKPKLKIAFEVIIGTTKYHSNYTDRLTVVRSKLGDNIIITATLTKLALRDINTYELVVLSVPELTSAINLDVKGW